MLKLDKHTKLVILDAVESCSEANPEVIEKDTGHKVEQFEKLVEKYGNFDIEGIDLDDLPIIVKALEWMLVIKNDSDILQIHREDGLRLLELLSQKKNEINESAWSLHSI